MVPSVGPTVGTEIPCPSRPIAARPVPTPTIAVMIGSDIAVTVPNMNSRMITAAIRPISSLDSTSGLETTFPR